ncbi:MAG: alpha/beta hydrolase [Actinobacteria bacterium]|nr:alpha/beta hydrolase [Actinomycetota bacterium]
MSDMERIAYDEFSMFGENISEYGLEVSSTPQVQRISTELSDGRTISALKWGSGEPRLVLVHGSGQNAHTWDTVALALNVPLIAVDLPGHGHSSWRDDTTYSPQGMAEDLAVVIQQHAANAVAIVGMSLGGLTCLALASAHPNLVPHLVLVDITPGVTSKKAKAVLDFINGPQSFASFDDLFARTKEHNPTRSESSLRRGILHNAKQIEDGSWQWRYDRRGQTETAGSAPGHEAPRSPMWEMISAWDKPLLMVRGGISPVVDDEDIAELRKRCSQVEVVVVDGAGHSVQGDRPVELANVLRRFAS